MNEHTNELGKGENTALLPTTASSFFLIHALLSLSLLFLDVDHFLESLLTVL